MARDKQTRDGLRDAVATARAYRTWPSKRPLFGAPDLAGVGPMAMSGRTTGRFARAAETALDDSDMMARPVALAVTATTAPAVQMRARPC